MASVEVKRIFLAIMVVIVVKEVVPRAVYDRVYTPDEFDALRVRNDIGGDKNERILHEKVVLDNAESEFELVGNSSLLRPVYENYLFYAKCKSGFKRIGGQCMQYLLKPE
ncbi:uncharacterized protein [Euwallacea similis]|uniref:uncharacterized protein isoform X1 n=1 Tax=Euwallacea similis TaxID=1736056 RepID=UPI00344BDD96